jgi:hypothetical protein
VAIRHTPPQAPSLGGERGGRGSQISRTQTQSSTTSTQPPAHGWIPVNPPQCSLTPAFYGQRPTGTTRDGAPLYQMMQPMAPLPPPEASVSGGSGWTQFWLRHI